MAAFLAFMIFAGSAYLCWLDGKEAYEHKGDPRMQPIWSGYYGCALFSLAALGFLIYALGLWDTIMEWEL